MEIINWLGKPGKVCLVRMLDGVQYGLENFQNLCVRKDYHHVGITTPDRLESVMETILTNLSRDPLADDLKWVVEPEDMKTWGGTHYYELRFRDNDDCPIAMISEYRIDQLNFTESEA